MNQSNIHRFTTVFQLLVRILGSLLIFTTALAQAEEAPHYTHGDASRDGTGKFYMGREISHVMGHRGADWLERPGREREERTDQLLSLLALEPGETVGDIGAGTGYFSLPIARMVGEEGRVLAVDIQPEMLAIIEQRAATEGLPNVTPVLATTVDPHLPENSVDVVLMVDAYHEFSHPREVMHAVRESLSSNGRVVLVEYRGRRCHRTDQAATQNDSNAGHQRNVCRWPGPGHRSQRFAEAAHHDFSPNA